MPRVSIRRPTTTERLAGGRTTPRATAVVRGITEVGQSIASFGEQVDALQKTQEATDANAAVSRFQQVQTEEFMKAQEAAPRGAPGFTEDFMERFDAAGQTVLDSVGPSARARTSQQLADLRNRTLAQSLQFQSNQGQLKRVDDIDDLVQSQVNILTINPGNMDVSMGLFNEALQNSGLNAETKDDLREKGQSQLFGAYATASIQDNPQAFLQQLNDGTFNDVAQGGQLATAKAQAQNEIDKRKREAERVQREEQVRQQGEASGLLRAEIAALNSAAGPQGLITPEQVQAIWPGEKGRRMAEELRLKTAANNVLQEIAIARPEDIPGILAGLVQPEGEDFDIEQEAMNIALNAVSQRNKMLSDDPAGYALQFSPSVREAFSAVEGIEDPTAQNAQLQRAYDLSIEEQQALMGTNAGTRVLSEASASRQAAEIMEQPANQRVAALDGMRQRLGHHFPQALSEMRAAKLPGSLALASQMFSRGDQSNANRLSRAIEMSPADQEKLLDSGDVTDIKRKVRDATEEFMQVFASNEQMGEASLRLEGATRLALQGAIENDKDVAAAVKAAFPFTIRDQLLIPDNVNADAAVAMMNSIQADIQPDEVDFGRAGIITQDPTLTEAQQLAVNEQERQIYIANIIANGRWVTMRNGAQLRDEAGNPVYRPDDTLYIVPWSAVGPAQGPRAGPSTLPEADIPGEIQRQKQQMENRARERRNQLRRERQ